MHSAKVSPENPQLNRGKNKLMIFGKDYTNSTPIVRDLQQFEI